MERVVTIGEKEYRLSSNAYTPIAYKQQFGQDYFSEMFSMFKNNEKLMGMLLNSQSEELEASQMDVSMLADFDMTFFHRLFWVYHKSANPQAEPFDKFFMNMDYFPFAEVAPVLMEILNQGMTTRKKSMNPLAPVMKSLQ